MLKLHTVPLTHEDIFLQHYKHLHLWALQITNNDCTQAEDLLHDAFIQFTITQPDLGAIRSLDGYLYGILRNLHLSQVRKATRSRLQQLSVVEYESADTSLRSVDPRDLIQVQDGLRRVCRYLCMRKETARAASILLLRFFHGYYPSEIAQILLTTPQAVKVRLGIARSETKACLEDPKRLRLISNHLSLEPFATGFARTSEDFLTELRETIFRSCDGECLSTPHIENIYLSVERTPVDTKDLAHIVSCPACLETVNEMLGLPPLSDRYPTDSIGKSPRSKKGPGDGSPGGGTSGGDVTIRRFRCQAREVFEHHPQELCVAVNGYMQGSQKINSELSEQTLDLDLSESINFIEIFSEQQVRLLLMNVEQPPPEGPGEQCLRIELSDKRTIDLRLRFGSPWPTLHVVYYDPNFKEVESLLREVAEQDSFETDSFREKPSQKMGAVTSDCKHFITTLARLWFRLTDWNFWLRPDLITVLFAFLLIAAFLFIRMRVSTPTASAEELLRRSIIAEETTTASADQALHRAISMEERKVTGEVIARRRIEIWHSSGRGVTARRLYDERGALLAGDWRRGDGEQTIYHHGVQPQTQPAPEMFSHAPINFDNVWQLSPSAKDFTALIRGTGNARVEERSTSYAISYVNEAAGDTPALIRVTLVLRRTDFYPIEQTLLVRQGSELREYRLTETGFERRPIDAVAPQIFEPEPELLEPTANPNNRAVEKSKAAVSLGPQPLAPQPIPATAEIEIEALRLLNQVGADLNEQVTVKRTSEGQLRIDGLIETDARKNEILRALSPIAVYPSVQIELLTIEQALKRRTKERSATYQALVVERIEPDTNTPLVVEALERFFGGENDAQTKAKANRFAVEIIKYSRRAAQHASALKRLGTQFSLSEVDRMSEESRAKWLALLRAHARAYQEAIAEMFSLLEPIFPAATKNSQSEWPTPQDTQSLTKAIAYLHELSLTHDQEIRSAFAVSSGNQTASSFGTPQFWKTLRLMESIAAALQRVN